MLSLYALLIWRTLRILTMSKNLFGSLIAGGILAMLMFQVFVNVGMTIGIMPVTGVPLPLMSYGGSSVLVTFLAIGLLEVDPRSGADRIGGQGAGPDFVTPGSGGALRVTPLGRTATRPPSEFQKD